MNEGDKYFEDLKPILKDLERFALHLTRDRESSRDLLSESILRGAAAYKNLKNKKALLSFMFTIIYRTNRDEFERKKRYAKIEDIDWENIYSNEIYGENLADLKLLYHALDMLDADSKNVIVLAELMEVPHKEIASIMNISIANVKVKTYRAKKKLKRLIESGEAMKSFSSADSNKNFDPINTLGADLQKNLKDNRL